MKRSFLVLAAVCSITLLCLTKPLPDRYQQHKYQEQQKFDPATTLIATDLDDVVIKNRESNIYTWLAYPSNWNFALTLNTVKNKYHIDDTDKLLEKVATLYPKFNNKIAAFKKVLVRAQPIHGTMNILTTLHNRGYHIMSASNMARGTYFSLRENKILPDTLFKRHFYFVKTKKQNKQGSRYFKKPNIHYYLNLKRYVEKKYPGKFKQIIFIDDKKSNVRSAQNAGLTAIHFKSSRQLQRELKKLGLAV